MIMDAKTTLAARVAAALRHEMEAQHRPVRELAAELGVSPKTVATRLRGEVPLNLAELERVASWLGTTPSELLARADARTQTTDQPALSRPLPTTIGES